ncbi:CAP domain-containing protein [Apiosordaria backusii]|uniref:CAP domain-containing protein n=1 Tax=Apiosordaria backusii TaxID=314023 RepID=A0AA39ZS32_9PEZI|nr:CAP domain-containing protein [Apiosordaria backusii]
MAIDQEIKGAPLPTEQAELPSPPVIEREEPAPIPSEEETPEPIFVSSATPPPSDNTSSFFITAAAIPPTKTITVTPDVLAAFNLHNSARRSNNNVGRLQHASNTGQGENLYWASGGGFAKEPCANGTKSWLEEGSWYTGQKVGEPAKGVIGHYTQCMWSRTTKVGIASVGDGKGGVYVVARYSPPGNFVGQRPY